MTLVTAYSLRSTIDTKSYMLQQASKSPFSYCHNHKLQGYNNLKLLYSNWYKPFWYYTPLDTTIYTLPGSYDTASYYITILPWYLIQQPNLLIYTIDSASFLIILWFIDTKPNTATLMIWYSDMFLLIRQYSLLLYSDWYNKLLC